jgi:muramidase (phage lysozyme)
MNERQFLEKSRQTPEAQRLLKTIRFAEGTAGPKGYKTMFGGGTFNDLSRHPDRVVHGNGYSSAAAGAYQFLPGTWQSHAKALGLQDFGEVNQDIAALRGIRSRLMPIGGLETLRKEGLSQRVAAALAPEWASFPTETGRSYYGQPVKPLAQLQKYYGAAPVSAPASPPAVMPPPPTSAPPPVNAILSSLGLMSPGTEAKKNFAQEFALGFIRPLLPNIFGTTP